MRSFLTAAMAAIVLATTTGSAFAFDPATGQSWQRATRPAAVAYFRLPFHGTTVDDKVAYGFALTAPTPRSYTSAPFLIADAPKILDLRFDGATPEALRLNGRLAWSQGSHGPEGEHLNLLGGLGDLVLGLAGTALALYGIYRFVDKKKDCPAGQTKSTSSGVCVALRN